MIDGVPEHFADRFRVGVFRKSIQIMFEPDVINLDQCELFIVADRFVVVTLFVGNLNLCQLLVLQLFFDKLLNRKQETELVLLLGIEQKLSVVKFDGGVRVFAQELQTPDTVCVFNKVKKVFDFQGRKRFLDKKRVIVEVADLVEFGLDLG